MTVRDSITRTRARTPGAEDYPTSMAAHDPVLSPTQCGITEVTTMCAQGGHKPNISRCMPGAGLSRRMRGKVLPHCQPSSRIGENPPYGMIGRVEETSASFEARTAPRTSLGQIIIVENTTGAAGTIGVGRVARAPPDGYTICIGHWGTHVVSGAIYELNADDRGENDRSLTTSDT